jgi:hypothetical protein
MSDSFALGDGPYHFFVRSSFSAAWSSIDSAKSFFSLRFSSSSDRRRLASDTSMPPYLAANKSEACPEKWRPPWIDEP